MDVVQAVLGRRVPAASFYRMDIPDAVSEIIRKMTQKQIDDRYHSTSGLKHDLVEVQKLLGDGDSEALANFKPGSKDVSSFFVLPTGMFGREEEHERIVRVIEKVSKRQRGNLDLSSSGIYGLHSTSASSISDERFNAPGSSDTSSQGGKEPRGSPALTATPSSHTGIRHLRVDSQDKLDTIVSPSRPPTNTANSRDSLEVKTNLDHQSSGPKSSQSTGNLHGSAGLPSRQGSAKYRRKGKREVVIIVGAAGLGKSSLIQSTQGEIRRLGYFASVKFDPAKRAPFEPLLRAMGSLFRQIFSESDVNSDYHNNIRANVRAFWPTLCSMLDLPENLVFWEAQSSTRPSNLGSQQGPNKSLRVKMTESSSMKSGQSGNSGSHLTSDFLRGASSTRPLKFMNIFLEVLRVLSSNKLICLCLDDLHHADEESLDLIFNIISRKLGVALIITCREEEALPSSIRSVLDNGSVNVTRIALAPLSEQQVVKYVAAALNRQQEYVVPLAIVCLERTNGNPFYLKQMLEVCHRKGCIWYSWKSSLWEYDIDRVFSEFETENYGQQLNTSFVTKRLQDLPPAARSILAWASLLGNTFSFKLIQRLLSGEFDYFEDMRDPAEHTRLKSSEVFTPQPAKNVIEGLQATLQSYILMPGSDDDQFCFSHDRYIQASVQLRECHNVAKMHFIITQTMMKYSDTDKTSLYSRARHVCLAASVIKSRVQHRRRFRQLLFLAAQQATESGARSSALQYYEACLDLMQPDPWKEGVEDAFYDETLSVYSRAAELYWYQGQNFEAHKLIDSIFRGGRSAADKAPAWILQSRLFAQRGDLSAAFQSLTTSLLELGLNFDEKPTWETCDKEYRVLQEQLEGADFIALVEKPFVQDPSITLIGAVLTEAISAAYWSDSLLFYQMAIKWVDFHLRSTGTFYQSGLGFAYFALIGISRFADLKFGSQIHDVSDYLLRRSNDLYTVGRGLTLSAIFITHLLRPIREQFDVLEEAMERSLICGDKHVFLFSVGGIALSRLFLGMDMAELETYCNVAPEDFGDWTTDLRGGVLLTAVRQIARSLQGKTNSSYAKTVMSDEQHDTTEYMEFINKNASNIERPRDFYNSLLMIPLFLFGHYEHAIKTGSSVIETMRELWSCRNSRITYFYLSLSIIARLRENPADVDRDSLIIKVRGYKEKIDMWQSECDVNYLMWSLMVEAELNELTGDYHDAIQAYEAAIDHTVLHDFMLEQALATELLAEFYIRRGAKRAARSTMLDAIGNYSRVGANGKANQLRGKHEWVLKGTTAMRTADAGVQTASSIGEIGNTQFRIEENERQETQNLGKQTAGDRTQAWVGPGTENGSAGKYRDSLAGHDAYGLGLDVLDLQSILEFNQAISSELQIDRLLAQMTEIILESAGAQADFAGVVIEGEAGWCIAASGTADNISSKAVPLSEIQDETQKQVLLYTMRFKEVVFVHNVVNDDRFCNTPSIRSVISLPIFQGNDLLGILYLEGQPNSFTDRNLGVLQLLCNQVGISIANALLFRRVRKVSASNTSMIESQKRALAKAREAEIKAKLAEAEAMRNVQLKEEAAKAKSMFLANVSHELRTPLNGVIGMSELLKATSLNKEQDGYADSIRVCADTLLTVINDILDFSKLEAGKMKLFSVPLNLKETIAEVVRALSYTNLERGLQTIEDLDLDSKMLVMGDPVRLHQIFMNLLSNSYKFTAKGSVTVRSRTEYEDDREIRVTCSVADTGIGITQEQVSRLFKPFSQADSSTQRSYGGSGLGLSICKALVNVLNGKIWLESQLGLGTTVSFTITFPKAPNSAVASNTEVSAKEPDPMATWSSDVDGVTPRTSTASFFDLTQIPRDQLRICIAEDNPINQKIAVSFVIKLGFKCEAFSDGLQAYEALRRKSAENQPFHLVLMDVQMPVLDGYAATEAIRKDDDPAVRGVLIIAMTASAIRGDREKCLQAGMNNYLAKPVRAAVLKSMLEDYLAQPRSALPNLQGTAVAIAKDALGDVAQNEKNIKALNRRPDVLKRISTRNAVPSQIQNSTAQMDANGLSSENLSLQDTKDVDDSRPSYNRDDSEETVTPDKIPPPSADRIQTVSPAKKASLHDAPPLTNGSARKPR